MSRSGYTEDIEDSFELGRWRGVVASAIRGKRGQAFLREMIEALDAMPEKRLIAHELTCQSPAGVYQFAAPDQVCAIGSVGARRKIDMGRLDPEDHDTLAGVFGIASPLVQEIEWVNDDWDNTTPEQRWVRVRRWAVGCIKEGRDHG